MLSAEKIKPKNANTITNTPNLGHVTLVPPFFPASVGFFHLSFFLKLVCSTLGAMKEKKWSSPACVSLLLRSRY